MNPARGVSADRIRGALPVLYLAMIALALVPVLACEIAPLGDMPNHLARVHILNAIGTDPDLQKVYVTHWQLFGFQTTDFLLPPLARLFGLAAAQKVFIAATFLVLVGGTCAIHRAVFGRVGVWPIAAVLFLFNLPLAVGQVSFLFSTGLALLLFAGWLVSAPYRGAARTLVFGVASFALLLCHFFAFAAYALVIGAYELGRCRHEPSHRARLWRLVEAGLPLLVPVLCYVLAFGQSVHGPTSYGALIGKPIAWAAALVAYAQWSDAALVMGAGLGLWLIEKRIGIGLAPAMRLPALAVVAAAVAMPQQLSGVLGADIRLPTILAFLLIGASDVSWRNRRQAGIFLLCVLGLLGLRLATITPLWQSYAADYDEFRAADTVLPRGSRVLVLPDRTRFRELPRPLTPYPYVAAFAVIDRSVFLPHLYTMATPLAFVAGSLPELTGQTARDRHIEWHPQRPDFSAVDPETIRQVEAVGRLISKMDVVTSTIDWSDWPEQFDYVIDMDFGRHQNPVPALLTEVHRGSYFSIYRIHPPGP